MSLKDTCHYTNQINGKFFMKKIYGVPSLGEVFHQVIFCTSELPNSYGQFKIKLFRFYKRVLKRTNIFSDMIKHASNTFYPFKP